MKFPNMVGKKQKQTARKSTMPAINPTAVKVKKEKFSSTSSAEAFMTPPPAKKVKHDPEVRVILPKVKIPEVIKVPSTDSEVIKVPSTDSAISSPSDVEVVGQGTSQPGVATPPKALAPPKAPKKSLLSRATSAVAGPSGVNKKKGRDAKRGRSTSESSATTTSSELSSMPHVLDIWSVSVVRKGEKNYNRQRIRTHVDARFAIQSCEVLDARSKIVVMDGRIRQIRSFSDGINVCIDVPEYAAPEMDKEPVSDAPSGEVAMIYI